MNRRLIKKLFDRWLYLDRPLRPKQRRLLIRAFNRERRRGGWPPLPPRPTLFDLP